MQFQKAIDGIKLQEPTTWKYADALLVSVDLAITTLRAAYDDDPQRYMEIVKSIFMRQKLEHMWEQLQLAIESELFSRGTVYDGSDDIYERKKAAMRNLINNLWSNKDTPRPAAMPLSHSMNTPNMGGLMRRVEHNNAPKPTLRGSTVIAATAQDQEDSEYEREIIAAAQREYDEVLCTSGLIITATGDCCGFCGSPCEIEGQLGLHTIDNCPMKGTNHTAAKPRWRTHVFDKQPPDVQRLIFERAAAAGYMKNYPDHMQRREWDSFQNGIKYSLASKQRWLDERRASEGQNQPQQPQQTAQAAVNDARNIINRSHQQAIQGSAPQTPQSQRSVSNDARSQR